MFSVNPNTSLLIAMKEKFISIDKSKELEELRKVLFKINCQNRTKNFFPHISLLYGIFQTKIKENLITSLPRLKRSFTIDKISLVEINEDISLWKISETFSFKTALTI